MARSLLLSNGYLSVALDDNGFVRDIYYPHVGLENHVSGNKHRIGIRVDGYFSWLDDPEWRVSVRYQSGTMIGEFTFSHERLGLEIITEDLVYNELPIFLRHFVIQNKGQAHKEIHLFFGQEFAIGETRFRNTGFYDPIMNCLLHYKGRRVFLVNGMTEMANIDQYTLGVFGYEGKEGSFRDAEDGELSKNAVEHGPVDSVFRLCPACEGKDRADVYYWLCAAETVDDAYKLNAVVLHKTPEAMVHSTKSFWSAWVKTRKMNFFGLSEQVRQLYLDSLFVLRSHVDHDGGIIASVDSDMLLYGKDSYGYVWPRDAAYISMVLDKAGYSHVTRPFFTFCKNVLHPDGYLHHKFQADMSLGSTWHSSIKQKDWLEDKILQLPIQEDETATVIYALWNHYLYSKDIEYIELLYKPLIEKAADFMVAFRSKKTGLPIHSYDLWEEVTGITTYTCAAVYGGLTAAAEICTLLGKTTHARDYRAVADDIVRAMKKHLYDEELKSFVRVGYQEDDHVRLEKVVDISSLMALWYYNVLTPDDPQFASTQLAVEQRLRNREGIGGFIRYEGDSYYREPGSPQANPWIITTLWDLQRRIKFARDGESLKKEIQDIEWVVDRLGGRPVLAEQFHPYSGEPLSAMPLAWSHAVFVETVLMYLEKVEEFGLCTECLPR